jgi:hypothetical protein
MQIELIQQENDTPSIYTEFLESGHEGFHQFAWWVDDFDSALGAATSQGWPIVWSGGGENGSASYAYLERSKGPETILELTELTASVRGVAKLVRDAAADWDGTDPIRTLG